MRRYPQKCGIYKITNLINNKIYIGQSIDIYERWHKHKYADSEPSVIHSAIRKYGLDNFSFEIIEECSKELLNEREIYWIDHYDSYHNGYNCTIGGDTPIKSDYNEMLQLWQQGYNCTQIAELLHCKPDTVGKALHYYDISEEDIRSRSNHCKKKPLVAIDITTNTPLKIFNSSCHVCEFFHKPMKDASHLVSVIRKKYSYFGYYWEHLNDNNHPTVTLTDDEFLSYQRAPLKQYTEEERILLSEKHRHVKRCSREELKNLIRTSNFKAIGKQFGVSDNAIRKWCDFYNLPRRVKDIKNISDEDWINI